MPNISKFLLQAAGSFCLLLVAGLASPTPAARNHRSMAAVVTEDWLGVHVKRSDREIPQKPVAGKALEREHYQIELAKLDALDRARDLDGLIRVADDLEKRWGRPGGQYYGLLMLEVCNLLQNHFSDAGIFASSQSYISNALARSDSFPLGLEIRLVRFLSRDLTSADSNDPAAWSRERRAKVGFWLHAWARLKNQINRNFDFSDRARLNVRPPEETGLPAGIVPEGIRDPKLRAQYEAAIAANAKKGREWDRQHELRALDEAFSKIAEAYVVRVYSQPPYHIEELRQHLTAYRLNREIRERVIAQVRRNVTVNQ